MWHSSTYRKRHSWIGSSSRMYTGTLDQVRMASDNTCHSSILRIRVPLGADHPNQNAQQQQAAGRQFCSLLLNTKLVQLETLKLHLSPCPFPSCSCSFLLSYSGIVVCIPQVCTRYQVQYNKLKDDLQEGVMRWKFHPLRAPVVCGGYCAITRKCCFEVYTFTSKYMTYLPRISSFCSAANLLKFRVSHMPVDSHIPGSVVYRTENQFDTIRSKKSSIFDTISIRYRYSIFRYDTVR